MLAVSLLGSFQIKQAEQVVTDFRYGKVRALLAYLMVEQQLTHHRDFLTSLLWPEQNEKKARHSLRQALSTLRRALGDDNGKSPTLIANRSTVQVNPESETRLDVQEFEELLTECERHSHADAKTCAECMEYRREAMTIYQGDFLKNIILEDCPEFEEWIWWKREKLSRLAMDALVHLTQYHERRNELSLARYYAQYQLDLEPWREEAHRHLMRILVHSGERSAALKQYEICCRILKSDLDVEPDEKTQQLYQKIRHAATAPQVNYPIPLTPLVNRNEELAEISLMLTEPNRRLITLVGPSGIGKTRLSLEIAKNKQNASLDGVYFVPLDTVHHANEAWVAIADIVGFTEVSQSSTVQNTRVNIKKLIDYLSQQEMLLILDNFEQVEHGEEVIAQILRGSDNVKLIVTSRTYMNSPWESVLELEGLAVPPIDDVTDSYENNVDRHEDIEAYSAIRLFIQSAQRVHRSFTLDTLSNDEKSAMIEICQAVGGMPLAIELAASLVRVSPCRQILQGIKNNLAFLRTNSTHYPERHRNIQQIFQKTWDALSTNERRLLEALVYAFPRVSFDLEDAEILGIGATFHSMTQLVDKCLIRCNRDGEYTIHELLCRYILEEVGSELKMPIDYSTGSDNKGAIYHSLTIAEQITEKKKHIPDRLLHSASTKHSSRFINDGLPATNKVLIMTQ